LNDAQTIADAAAVVGGLAGILVADTVGAPILTGAIGGMVLVGLAAGVYASFTNLRANELDTAMAEAAWPSGYIGYGTDLASGFKLIAEYKGIAPYTFIAGGVVGAMAYFYQKYDPSFRQLHLKYGATANSLPQTLSLAPIIHWTPNFPTAPPPPPPAPPPPASQVIFNGVPYPTIVKVTK